MKLTKRSGQSFVEIDKTGQIRNGYTASGRQNFKPVRVRRRGENLLMQNAMRGFQSLFEQRAMPVRWLRNTGMRWVNQAGPVKGFFARQAMGRTTDLPARAKPPAFGARADSR